MQQPGPVALTARLHPVGHGHARTTQLGDHPRTPIPTQPKPHPLTHTHALDDLPGPGHHGAVLGPKPLLLGHPHLVGPLLLEVLLGTAGDLTPALLGELRETSCDRLTGGPVARSALLQVVVGALMA